MAQNPPYNLGNVVVKPKYPSRFGSHTVMVNQDATDKLEDKDLVVCQDDEGFYIAEARDLDTGMADPSRHNLRTAEEKEFVKTKRR